MLDCGLRGRIRENLTAFDAQISEHIELRQAAVALVVTDRGSGGKYEPAILLTLRPLNIKRHANQYALPGGRLDDGENAEDAALRELDEELGLKLGPSCVLGRLDDYPTRSGFRIAPIVVWAGADCTIRPAASEVAEVYRIPFSELDSAAIPVFEPGIENTRPVLCADFTTLGHRLYSPTASIIYQFREVALRGQPTRVAHFDQPKFAWR